MDFLNQDTAVLHGPEKYARIHDMPLVYADVQKIRRGYYEVNFECLEANPATTKTGELTGRFMKRLERAIIRDPQYYLWSHRRWKLKREKKGA
jgi:KDO2-lipid IV(A) lauroyltransferase